MEREPRPMPPASFILLFIGLLCIGVAFTMLDRGWLHRPPVMGVQHPIAAAVGVVGSLCCLAAVLYRRIAHRRNSD